LLEDELKEKYSSTPAAILAVYIASVETEVVDNALDPPETLV
jgi:hypothetical protein